MQLFFNLIIYLLLIILLIVIFVHSLKIIKKITKSHKLKFENRDLIILFILISIFLVLYNYNSIQNYLLYKTTNVFQDEPLGYFINDYQNLEDIKISNIQSRDINTRDLSFEQLKENYNGLVVNWSLNIDKSFQGHTSVVGICRYHLWVYPNDYLNASIEIDHQGRACEFWKNINDGDSIKVIGELNINNPDWTEVGKKEPYATKYVIDIRPMVLKHLEKYYVDTSLPLTTWKKLMELI